MDDGKSTLIGRLLYDSKSVFEDQLASVQKSNINRSGGPDRFFAAHRRPARRARAGHHHRRRLPLFFDSAPQIHHCRYAGPRAVHAQHGHRRFDRRSRRGSDGRHQGRSARSRGATPTSRICSACSTSSPPSTKWTWSDFRRKFSIASPRNFDEFADQLGIRNVYAVPVSALEGDNVVRRSKRMPWFEGPPLLEYLEAIPAAVGSASGPLRFPVQYVIRPDASFRGFAGQLVSGELPARRERRGPAFRRQDQSPIHRRFRRRTGIRRSGRFDHHHARGRD